MTTMMDVMRKGFGREERPEEAIRGGVLRHLEEAGGWVDVMDLPFPAPLGRDARRALLRSFAREGRLELVRHPVYPNLQMARITEDGRTVLGGQVDRRAG